MAYKPQISIIGSRNLDIKSKELIKNLATHLVDNGYRIITGGLGSLPKSVHLGAIKSKSYSSGDTIALLPGFDPEPAKEHADIVIPTGLDIGRNVLVANGDIVIAINGGAGTLSEIALAWQMNRPIISIKHGGWSEKLAGQTIDQRFPNASIYSCDSIEEIIKIIPKILAQKNSRHEGIK